MSLERGLWILIAALLFVILIIGVQRSWKPTDPRAIEQIEKAKDR